MEVTLRLKYAPHEPRPTTSWFVNSPFPKHWLKAAIDGFVGADGDRTHELKIRILPVPRSLNDRSPIGALVVAGSEAKVTLQRPSSNCLPYGSLTDRVFLPVDSRLEPEVTPSELEELLSRELTYLWHPRVGLVAYERGEILSLVDLLCSPPKNLARYDQAHPGIMLPNRLTSIGPAESPSTETILESGRDDIGTQGSNLSALPPQAGEPQPGVGTGMTFTGLKFLEASMQGLNNIGAYIKNALQSGTSPGSSSKVAQGSSGSNWLEQMQQWAQQRMDHLNQAFTSQREKEINRLMNLLATNPDEGLKYALPIGGDAHRGAARPTGQLSQRNTNFNLGNLGGGGPADHWDLSWQHQQELLTRYRELANREITLGRHRRAAYIYAELLSDYASAASALKQGKHWREAAVLYKERLSQPLTAAACLKEGGYWTEAIELYIELEEYEEAGDIYKSLDQHEEAATQYQRAVEACLLRKDHLTAAQILESKQNDVDGAIATLADAWPHTKQAVPALSRLFETYGRHAQHAAASQKIRQLAQATTYDRLAVPLVENLASNANNYPDREVQNLAADTTRVVASRILTQKIVTETDRVLKAIKQLAPEDRLLARDCLRYENNRGEHFASARIPSMPKQCPLRVRTIHLNGFAEGWSVEAAATSGSAVFAAVKSRRTKFLALYRFSWRGEEQLRLDWNVDAANTLLLTTNPIRADVAWLNVMGGQPFKSPIQSFGETNELPVVTRVESQMARALGSTMNGHGTSWLADIRGGSPTLTAIGPDRKLLHSVSLSEFQTSVDNYLTYGQPLPIFASGESVYMGFDNKFVAYQRGMSTTTLLEDSIIRITGSLPNTRRRTAVALNTGAVLFWDDFHESGVTPFATEMPAPMLTFNRGGFVIAAWNQRCEVYSTKGNAVNLIAEMDLAKPAIEVLSGDTLSQFGVVYEDGTIDLFALP